MKFILSILLLLAFTASAQTGEITGKLFREVKLLSGRVLVLPELPSVHGQIV